MFEIPQKFTGIDAEASDFKAFKTLCFTLQDLGFFKVINITDYDYPKNYYDAEVCDSSGTYHLLMNCFVPYLCFKKGADESVCLLDKASVSSAINSINSDFIVLSCEQLNQTVTDSHLVNLSRSERNDVKSWLPATVAEVMFSWFFD
ncbi:hypothetical protein CWB96_22435 [Pseudoalteromonas citrea]|uniref:Uncharacterized protein n=1 Tax=Pseudoalteromonas citrea TaxID=43655 RepID=A0A5S3XFG0_9GAMM|nr:hypothetical protein [Pseudoalteromonas citrea]TMP37838.1 hypothetical protein CWB97_22510 [Pseudoalteromonas citrea]TMP51222.1 hypothetical protein CWB96_22435 [Pseudoalteromonas citrea]